MGSLAALLSLGLFDEQGGCAQRPTWQLTAPVFERATIHLNSAYCAGKDFTIIAHNQGPQNIYIQSAKLNGQPLTGCWFYHADFAQGGTLELDLGPTPNKNWGVTPPLP